MADHDPSLGGFDHDAGRNVHQMNRPTLNPVPSLLRSLLSEHLDPGYAAAAAERNEGGQPRPRWIAWVWQVAAAVLVAVVFAAAAAQARSVAPGVKQTQEVLVASVRSDEAATNRLAAQRDALTADVDGLRRSRLEGDAEGQRLLGKLDEVSLAAASTAVTGPGLTVTLTDPGASRDLTDLSKQRVPGSRQVVLDRDLQLGVNSLWGSGAEAIAVGSVRVGPNVTIRQAGGAILVDNQPVSSPYVITAIGPPNTMDERFALSPGLERMRLLEASYGVGVSVSVGDTLTVPAGNSRETKFASQIGTR